jgi:hypothetical protein
MFGGLGPTRWRWRRDVRRVVESIERRWPNVRCNTYVAHPWVGWSRVSIDIWGTGGRGDPVPLKTGHEILQYLWERRVPPAVRHTIYLHQLRTSFGGASFWGPDDHSDDLRHVHVTYWK